MNELPDGVPSPPVCRVLEMTDLYGVFVIEP